MVIPQQVPNLIGGELAPSSSGDWIDKLRPADATHICHVARSTEDDVDRAVAAARAVQQDWAERTPVERGEIVRWLGALLRNEREELA